MSDVGAAKALLEESLRRWPLVGAPSDLAGFPLYLKEDRALMLQQATLLTLFNISEQLDKIVSNTVR